MNKKAFTLMELLLVVAILAIFAASAIPYLMQTFGGFGQITNQEAIINSLQEVSTVISRKIVFDNEEATESNINTIITDLAANNGITVTLTSIDEIKDVNNKVLPEVVKITLEGKLGADSHSLSFIVYPAIK